MSKLTPRTIKRYGWRPDLPDARDHYMISPPASVQLPPSTDLRSGCPPPYDQGELGSCTANAIAGALEFDQRKQNKPTPFTPSRLFIYYNERVIEHTVNEDSGAQIRDGIKSVAVVGAPPEPLWKYVISKFKSKPPVAAFNAAKDNQAILYKRIVQSLDDLRACLAKGFPFVFGFAVYQSFESASVAKTGEVPMPGKNEQVLGGHAVLCVGYDDATKRFLVRNSWGESWGKAGYFTIPYQYVLDRNLCDDFWYISQVE